MPSYSEENELYLNNVKILTNRSTFSHKAHFFQKNTVSNCPFNIGMANMYAEDLLEKDIISDYSTEDPSQPMNLLKLVKSF